MKSESPTNHTCDAHLTMAKARRELCYHQIQILKMKEAYSTLQIPKEMNPALGGVVPAISCTHESRKHTYTYTYSMKALARDLSQELGNNYIYARIDAKAQ